jgi:hypothetical protein
MPARKILYDFEVKLGEDIVGVDRSEFDAANFDDYLDVSCVCGKTFRSKRADLVARFNRGNNIKCVDCVNKINSHKRFKND